MHASKMLHVFTVWNGPAVLMTKSAPLMALSMDWISETSTSRNVVVLDRNPGYLETVSSNDALFLEARTIFEDGEDSERAFWIAFAELEPTRPVPPMMTIVLSPSKEEDTDTDDFCNRRPDEDTSCWRLLLSRKTHRLHWYLRNEGGNEKDEVVTVALILCVRFWASAFFVPWWGTFYFLSKGGKREVPLYYIEIIRARSLCNYIDVNYYI